MITITREIQFDAGHCLKNHEGHCHNLHGHRYKLLVSVALDQGDTQNSGSSDGMVVDFSFLKRILMEEVHDRFDHKFLIELKDPRTEQILKMQKDETVVLAFPPTVEMLASYIHSLIQGVIPEFVTLKKVTLYETPNNFAEVTGLA